ncbi:hypothetical protein [Synechococcus sp. PCC 7335]|uniref:hypothetical protein n=1 Tax=Synechococcus sp. (strain ATCC 29403 / PCC 7335) TaxID=91464 RepID=UPI0002D5DAE1|nr:hypothetical protein [Synechococcus sp. PCC 7335]
MKEEVEELTLDSIQVSVLPAEPMADVPVDIPLSSEVISEAAPAPIATPPEPVPVEIPQLEPDPVPMVSAAPAPPLDDNPDSLTDLEKPTAIEALESDKPPKSDSFGPQQLDLESTQASYDGFFATVAQVDSSLVPEFVVKDTYELDYLGNECFEDTASIESIVGVIVEDVNGEPQIKAGNIIQRTGYSKTDAALQAWLSDLESGGEGEGPDLKMESTFGESVYNWVFEQKNQVWFVDTKYEAYYFGAVINLIENAC